MLTTTSPSGRLASYTKTVIVYLALFTASAFVLAILHGLLTHTSFQKNWRWVHDSTIFPSNLFLVPAVGLLLLVRWFAPRLSSPWFEKAPKSFHRVVFLVLSIFLANALSQASGGCVWFVLTEGWWVRYGHGWLMPNHQPVPEVVVAGIDIFFSLLAFRVSYWYYRLYLLGATSSRRLRQSLHYRLLQNRHLSHPIPRYYRSKSLALGRHHR